jgi:antitoxin VapB
MWYLSKNKGREFKEVRMQTARIFVNGRSQAVRLPKEFRFSGSDVYIKKIGNMVVLLPKDDPWAPLINSLDQFSDDFMNTRDQPPQESRDSL